MFWCWAREITNNRAELGELRAYLFKEQILVSAFNVFAQRLELKVEGKI